MILQSDIAYTTGVKVDLPVLTDKDILDLKEFACKYKVDYVAASFVQSAADVRFIRSVLDEGGGFDVKIISKIENQEGLNNFKEVCLQGCRVSVLQAGVQWVLCWAAFWQAIICRCCLLSLTLASVQIIRETDGVMIARGMRSSAYFSVCLRTWCTVGCGCLGKLVEHEGTHTQQRLKS